MVPIRHYLDDELFGERQNHRHGRGRATRENHKDVKGIWFCIPRLGRDGYIPGPPVDASTDSESSLACVSNKYAFGRRTSGVLHRFRDNEIAREIRLGVHC